jgi:hypothetical protein
VYNKQIYPLLECVFQNPTSPVKPIVSVRRGNSREPYYQKLCTSASATCEGSGNIEGRSYNCPTRYSSRCSVVVASSTFPNDDYFCQPSAFSPCLGYNGGSHLTVPQLEKQSFTHSSPVKTGLAAFIKVCFSNYGVLFNRTGTGFRITGPGTHTIYNSFQTTSGCPSRSLCG